MQKKVQGGTREIARGDVTALFYQSAGSRITGSSSPLILHVYWSVE
jgi:hypothetical protein